MPNASALAMVDVSVVIPTYKHRDYILETLDSVFAQTFTNYEIIVVNDGSPDDTAAVLAPLVEAGKIRYIEQPNAGQSAARNRGWAEARGQFVAFLDDDDLWPPDSLEARVQVLVKDPSAGFVFGPYQQQRDGVVESIDCPQPPDGNWHRALLGQNRIVSPGQALIRRSLLEQIGGFDPNVWGADDWDLWIRLAAIAPVRFINTVTLTYRLHAANASRNLTRMMANMLFVIRKHHHRFTGFSSWRQSRLWVSRIYTMAVFHEGHTWLARRELAVRYILGDWNRNLIRHSLEVVPPRWLASSITKYRHRRVQKRKPSAPNPF